MTTKLRAYPDGDKAARVADMKAHREADRLVKGQYWEDGKGCAIGCQVHSNDHAEHARVFGIDVRLSHLQDAIFEALPNDEAMDFPVQFLEAIPEGADTSTVYAQWAARMLTRCIRYIGEGDEPWRVGCRDVVTRVRDLFESDASDDATIAVDRAAAHAADVAHATRAANARAAAAALAAAHAADAATRAAKATYAVDAAALAAAADADAHVGDADAYAAAWDAARYAEVSAQRDDLLELLRACKAG
jgi:hypothetical protein